MTQPKKPSLTDWRERVLVYIANEHRKHLGEAYQHLFPKSPPRTDHLNAAMAAIEKATSRKSVPEIIAFIQGTGEHPCVVIFSIALLIGLRVDETPLLTPHVKGLSAPQTATALRRAVEDFPFLFDEKCRAAIRHAERLYETAPRHRPKGGKSRLTLNLLDAWFKSVFGPEGSYNIALEAFTQHFSGWSPGTAIRTRRRIKASPL